MRCLGKKKGKLEIETIIQLLLLTAFLIIAVSLFWLFHQEARPEIFSDYSCWFSNAMRTSSVVFRAALPKSCELKNIMEPADKAELARLLRATWWMYGRGTWDTTDFSSFDRIHIKYSFTLNQSLPLGKFGEYLFYHKKGELIADATDPKSDYHYIQGGSLGNTLCFDNKIGDRLESNITYFITFYDDRLLKGSYDKILISEDLNFGRNWGWKMITDLEEKYCKPFVILMKG